MTVYQKFEYLFKEKNVHEVDLETLRFKLQGLEGFVNIEWGVCITSSLNKTSTTPSKSQNVCDDYFSHNLLNLKSKSAITDGAMNPPNSVGTNRFE